MSVFIIVQNIVSTVQKGLSTNKILLRLPLRGISIDGLSYMDFSTILIKPPDPNAGIGPSDKDL